MTPHAIHVLFVVLSAVLGIRSALVRNAGGHSSILYVSRARFGLFYRRTPCENGSLSPYFALCLYVPGSFYFPVAYVFLRC